MSEKELRIEDEKNSASGGMMLESKFLKHRGLMAPNSFGVKGHFTNLLEENLKNIESFTSM